MQDILELLARNQSELIAFELTHVIQQNGKSFSMLSAKATDQAAPSVVAHNNYTEIQQKGLSE